MQIDKTCGVKTEDNLTPYPDLSEMPLVYPPAEDTFLLLKAATSEVCPGDRVLEMGCGQGLIAKALSKDAGLILAVDINPYAVRMAAMAGIPAVRGDLFCGIRGQFDLIIFNPPYLPTSDDERLPGWLNLAFDGGPTGRQTINRFLEGLREHITPNGRSLLLVSSLAGIDAVVEKAYSEGFQVSQIADESHFFEHLCVLRLRPGRSSYHCFK